MLTILLVLFKLNSGTWIKIAENEDIFIDHKRTGSERCNRLSIELIMNTVNFLNIRTPKKLVVITLKVEQDGVSLE